MNKIAHHTSIARGTYNANWGTPDWILDIVRNAFGGIDLDLCSSATHNKIVKARRFYSAEKPCPYNPTVRGDQVVWCNPPGPSRNVITFWKIWIGCIMQGACGGFLVYNADHFRMLPAFDMELWALFLRKRARFVGAPSQANFPSILILSEYERGLWGSGHLLKWGGV